MEMFMMIVMVVVALVIMFFIFNVLDCRPMFFQGYIYWFIGCMAIEMVLLELFGNAIGSLMSFVGWILPKILVIGGIGLAIGYFKTNKGKNDDSE